MFKNSCTNPNRVANIFGDVESVFNHFFDKTNDSSIEFRPRWDIAELNDSFSISLELPGVKPEDVHVEFEDGLLTIYGEKKVERNDEDVSYHQTERVTGSFKRTLEFSTPVEGDGVQANFENGLLVVSVPKSAKTLPRKIEINAANG